MDARVSDGIIDLSDLDAGWVYTSLTNSGRGIPIYSITCIAGDEDAYFCIRHMPHPTDGGDWVYVFPSSTIEANKSKTIYLNNRNVRLHFGISKSNVNEKSRIIINLATWWKE